jgi:hypothetical protein
MACVTVLAIAWAHGTANIGANAEDSTPIVLGWKQLAPPVTLQANARATGPVNLTSDDDDGTPAPPPIDEAPFMSRKRNDDHPAPTVPALDGQLVKIGGYVVPLEFNAGAVREFLLVPFVGACIHVPPPPANQIVYVTTDKPFTVRNDFEPVFVTGRMQVSAQTTDLADAAYTIKSAQVAAQ